MMHPSTTVDGPPSASDGATNVRALSKACLTTNLTASYSLGVVVCHLADWPKQFELQTQQSDSKTQKSASNRTPLTATYQVANEQLVADSRSANSPPQYMH